MKKQLKIISAFMSVIIILLSLASCSPLGNPEETTEPPQIQGSLPDESEKDSPDTGDVTDAEKIPTALELLIRADELADSYHSAVQTVINTMSMGGTPLGVQISVTKKNGNNCSYSVSADGYVAESIVLRDGNLSYFSDIDGAFLLTGADLDDFDRLINGSDSDMFDYSHREYFTGGTVEKTDSGYNVTVEFSDAGKEMMAKMMGAEEGYTVTFEKLGISAKIDKDGNSPEQMLEMEMTMSFSGMSLTMSAVAEMTFTDIGGNVAVDDPLTTVEYLPFGTADSFIAFYSAEEKQALLASGTMPFEFERGLSLTLTNGLVSIFNIKGAFDPAKGINYSAAQPGTSYTISYYSDFAQVAVEESGNKYIEPSITWEDLFYTLLIDLDSTNYGLSSYLKVISVDQAHDGVEYNFTIIDDIADSVLRSYIANYMSLTVTGTKIKSATQYIKVSETGELSRIDILITATVTINDQNIDVSLGDSVYISGYNTANITPIVVG